MLSYTFVFLSRIPLWDGPSPIKEEYYRTEVIKTTADDSRPLPVFVDDALVKYVHARHIVCGCFCALTAELSGYPKEHMVCRASESHSLALVQGKLLTFIPEAKAHNTRHQRELCLCASVDTCGYFLSKKEIINLMR